MVTYKKLAVVLGVLVIGAGAWYLNRGDKDKVATTAENTPASPAGTVSNDGLTAGDQDRATESHVASPEPRRLETAAERASADADRSWRPQPIETSEPVPPAHLVMPGERSGLGNPEPDDASTVSGTSVTLPEIAPSPTAAGSTLGHSDVTATTKPAIETHARAESTKTIATPAESPKASPTLGAAAPTKSTGATDTATQTHVIAKGDTFTSLAVKYLGHAKYASLIAKANPKVDPRKLYIGSKITIPAKPAEATSSTTGKSDAKTLAGSAAAPKGGYAVPPPIPARAYTVQAGETWYDLAERFLGKRSDYPELYEWNKERVGGNPHLLRAGTVIELPPRAKLPENTTGTKTDTK